MSDTSQKPKPDTSMSATTRHNQHPADPGADRGPAVLAEPARLQAIHDLIRSGAYHVPANAIADRMVEQLLVDRRRRRN